MRIIHLQRAERVAGSIPSPWKLIWQMLNPLGYQTEFLTQKLPPLEEAPSVLEGLLNWKHFRYKRNIMWFTGSPVHFDCLNDRLWTIPRLSSVSQLQMEKHQDALGGSNMHKLLVSHSWTAVYWLSLMLNYCRRIWTDHYFTLGGLLLLPFTHRKSFFDYFSEISQFSSSNWMIFMRVVPILITVLESASTDSRDSDTSKSCHLLLWNSPFFFTPLKANTGSCPLLQPAAQRKWCTAQHSMSVILRCLTLNHPSSKTATCTVFKAVFWWLAPMLLWDFII